MGDTAKRGRRVQRNHEADRRCERCGLQYNKFSVADHDRWCQESFSTTKEPGGESTSATTDVVARIVTVGLTPGGKPDIEYVRAPRLNKARPTTSKVTDSRLQRTGHGVPAQSSEPSGSGLIRCKKCGRMVAGSKFSTHMAMCSTGHAPGPSRQRPLPATASSPDQDNSVDVAALPPGRNRKFVICYICGKEYTVHSIGIHIPQCTKKFHDENQRLPIRERRAFPKKPEPPKSMPGDDVVVGGASANVDAAVQNYLEHCYTTFEDTLVPCRVCGRTFAADRHRIHEPNCKAKPLTKKS